MLIGRAQLLMTTGSQLETIKPFLTPPWDTPLGEIKNLGLDKDTTALEVLSQVKEEMDQGSMIIFTDGSFIQEVGGGAAIALTTDARSKAFGPMTGITNYEMEVMALSLALNYYIDAIEENTTPENNTLAIFSNSQSALQLMNNPLTMSTAQYLGKHLQELIQHISLAHTIKIHWTPGHHNVDLNEKPDEEARSAAESEGEQFLLPFSLSCAKHHVKQIFNTRGNDIDRAGYKSAGKPIAEASNRLEKGKAGAIFQLRAGHCPLTNYLARINAVPNNCCIHCGRKETTIHFLLYCPKYMKERSAFRNTLKEEEIKLDTRRANLILDCPTAFPYLADFIVSTHRFKHLRSYIDL